MDKEINRLLNESFDRELTAAEDQKLRSALNDSAALRQEKRQLEAIRNIVGAHKPAFAPGFASRVISQLRKDEAMAPLTETYLAFKRIALPLAGAAAVLLLFTLFSGESFSLHSIMGIDKLEPEYLTEFLLFNY